MTETTQLGLLTELLCQTDFSKRGIVLSQPITADCRYDFIADINGELIRLQCKTAHPELNDIISIRTVSKNWNSGEIHNYLDDVDYFYTNYNNVGYLLPIDICSELNRTKNIRLGNKEQYHSNNENALYGIDYTIDTILEKDFHYTPNLIMIEDRECHSRGMSKQNPNYYCKDCGKPITVKNGRCIDCFHLFERKVIRPDRKELKDLIRTTPFTTIAKKFSVTDNAVRKWCDEMNLPRRKSDIKNYTEEEWNNI